MTKKEQTHMAELSAERDLYRSFRFSEEVERDLPIPPYGEVTKGWLPIGRDEYARVEKAASEGSSHDIGDRAWEGRSGRWSWSQGGRGLYSTKRLALMQLRHEVCLRAARQLAKIDAEIREEEA